MINESQESNAISNHMLMDIKASTQSELNEDPNKRERMGEAYREQKDRNEKELNNLLIDMKDKMGKGRNSNSPMSSMSINGNNFSNNISNRNTVLSQSPFSGNNIGMNINMNNNVIDQNNININMNNNMDNNMNNNMNEDLDNDNFNKNTINSNHSVYRNSAYDDDDDDEDDNENIKANNPDNYLLKSNPGSVFMNNSQNMNNSNQNSIILNNNNNNNNLNDMFTNNPNNMIMNNNKINNNNFNNNSINSMKNMNMNQNSNNIINNNSNSNSNMMNNKNQNSNNIINNNSMINRNMNNNMMNNMYNNSRLMNNNNMNMINNNNNKMNNNNMINNMNMNMNNNNNMINTSSSNRGTLNMLNNILAKNNDNNNFNSNNNDKNKEIVNDGDIKYNNNIINISNPQDPQPGKNLFPMDNTQKKSKILDSKNNSINSKNQIKPINNGDISHNNSKTPLDINDQEKYDSLRKSQIVERHTLEMSSYYDYTPGEKEENLNELLEDMNSFGEIKKRDIEKQKRENPNKFISIEDAMKKGKNTNDIKSSKKILKYKNEYFVLSILAKALMSQGCTVEIEKDEPKNEEEKNEMNTTMQFLVNGMYNFKKYIFYFDFGIKANKELLKQTEQQKKNLEKFNGHLKNKLLKLLKLKVNDIIMTDPRILGPYSITAIIKKALFYELPEDEIYQGLKNDPSFNKIKKVEKRILLSGCILNTYMLDSRGNNKDGGWGFNETRGGHPYYPPVGWTGYGLRVVDRFDKGNNAWLDYHNKKGEWSVAYHGIGYGLRGYELVMKINDIGKENIKTGVMQEYQDSDDSCHPGEKVGEGIYVTPKPEVFDEYCGKFDYDGKKYKIAFMTRVMPDKIRCPVDNENIWVINGTDNEIRPYRILIKEVNEEVNE